MSNDQEHFEESNDRPAEEEALDIVPQGTLQAITRAEIDVQISTAKQYPRSVAKFLKHATSMATMNEEIAASCFYDLPRSGKRITGPSVRLAEICATAWGNIRYGARVIADDGRQITAQGMAHDLESNVAGTIETKRRVTDRKGRRFSDDMVVVTGNAACSIAKRNAILGVIPRAYVNEVERAARQIAIGDAKTLVARRADMVAYFQKMGIEAEQVFAAVEKAGIEDIGLDELAHLKGLATAIKDGEISVDEAFPPLPKRGEKPPAPPAGNGTTTPPPPPPVSRTDRLADELAGPAPQAQAPPAEPPPPAPAAPEPPAETEEPAKPRKKAAK